MLTYANKTNAALLNDLRRKDVFFHAGLADIPYCFGNYDAREVIEYFMNQKPRKDFHHKGFMAKDWDSFAQIHPNEWKRVFRQFYEGGILGVFTAAKNNDLPSIAIRLGGFDRIDAVGIWTYTTAFPKAHSTNVGKLCESAEFHDRETALKPVYESLLLFRKPLSQTYKKTLEELGTGTLNIRDTRILGQQHPGNMILCHHPLCRRIGWEDTPHKVGNIDGSYADSNVVYGKMRRSHKTFTAHAQNGMRRVPKYRCHHDCNVQEFERKIDKEDPKNHLYTVLDYSLEQEYFNVVYTGKASSEERDAGLLEFIATQRWTDGRKTDIDNPFLRGGSDRKNFHPTIKPLAASFWAATLLLPPGTVRRHCWNGYAGTGTEAAMAAIAGFEDVYASESDPEYWEIGTHRIAHFISMHHQLNTRNYTLLVNPSEDERRQCDLFTCQTKQDNFM